MRAKGRSNVISGDAMAQALPINPSAGAMTQALPILPLSPNSTQQDSPVKQISGLANDWPMLQVTGPGPGEETMSEPNPSAETPAGSETSPTSKTTGLGASTAAPADANTTAAVTGESAQAGSGAEKSTALMGKPWWGAFWVTVSLIALYTVFTLLLFLFADDQSASNENVWNRYIYLLGGFEAVVFIAVGWLFGREVNRGTVQVAQQSADAAKDDAARAAMREKQATAAAAKAKQAEDKAKAEAMASAEEAVKGRVLADALKATSAAGAADRGGLHPGAGSRTKGVDSDLQSMEMPDLSGFEEPVQPSLQESELRYLQQLAQRLFPDG